jgi:hypothetical protein
MLAICMPLGPFQLTFAIEENQDIQTGLPESEDQQEVVVLRRIMTLGIESRASHNPMSDKLRKAHQ